MAISRAVMHRTLIGGITVLLFATASGMLCQTAYAVPADVVVAAKRGPRVRVVTAAGDDVLQKTARWCCEFLAKRGYAVEEGPRTALGDHKGPIWVLETVDHCPIAKSLGSDASFLNTARADAYVLNISELSGRSVASIVGLNAAGVRSGVARLVGLMSEKQGRLTAPQTTEERTPFFPIRRLHVCPTGRIAQGNEWCIKNGLPAERTWADTLWTNWSDDRLRVYAEQLWLLGFNSVEIAEIRGYRGVFSDDDLKNEITPKILTFARALRDNGLQVSQFIWGQSLFKEGDNLCWNSPEERKVMEREYRRLAQTYGPYVDHIVVHVGDPGGCSRNGCDAYITTQQIATFLMNEYRKVNSKVTATLSTWANEGFFKGSPNETFLDDTYSPKDLGIALHRWYDASKANMILSSGRECDIWGWYLSDFELALDMALFMRRLDSYFSSLPATASRHIRAISTELNFSGWPQVINAYVSAQKMWSPQRSLDDIEREFCAGMFGDENAEAMMKIYRACEAYVHPGRHHGFIPASDCLPVVFGTPEYNSQLKDALAALSTVKLDSNSPCRFTSATDPQAMLDYLARNLRVIYVFSQAFAEIISAAHNGADKEQLEAILQRAEQQAAAYKMDPDYASLVADVRNVIKAAE